ncbi:MAG: DUF4900 domain-containing protein [Balneolaceae bacterium]|nr:DUF4900 domain-containing protein [Balneolaceae bacterium]
MGRAMLLIVTGMVVITGIIQANNNRRTAILPERSQDYFYEQQARNESISLVDNAIEYLKNDNEWEDSISTGEHFQGSGKLYSYSSTTVPDSINHSVDQWNQYRVLLFSTSEYKGYSVQTEVLMQRDSFSKYSYFTESELSSGGNSIYWYTDDEVTGPVHTNGTFKIAGTPTFHGFVTSPNMYDSTSSSSSPNLYGGSDFNAPENNSLLNSNVNQQVQNLSSQASSGGLRFNEHKKLEFYVDGDDGYVRTKSVQTYSCGYYYTETCYSFATESDDDSYRLSDYNGIISVDGQTFVDGTVKGEATVHSTSKIHIMGDIQYNTDPLTDSNSTDILGLVSETDVEIDEDAHTASGSSDIDIQATIMALDTSFGVEDYSSSGFRGNINLLGGIIQVQRGAVGTFGGYYGQTGYSKNYVYDTRLRGMTPPLFPRESIFSIVYWKDKVVSTPDS